MLLYMHIHTSYNCIGMKTSYLLIPYIGSSVEKEVFNSFYDKLVNILRVMNIYDHLVTKGILTTGDIEEIIHEPRSKLKASFVLQKIDSSLEAGITDSFYKLLEVMKTSLNNDVKVLVNDIRRALMIGELYM